MEYDVKRLQEHEELFITSSRFFCDFIYIYIFISVRFLLLLLVWTHLEFFQNPKYTTSGACNYLQNAANQNSLRFLVLSNNVINFCDNIHTNIAELSFERNNFIHHHVFYTIGPTRCFRLIRNVSDAIYGIVFYAKKLSKFTPAITYTASACNPSPMQRRKWSWRVKPMLWKWLQAESLPIFLRQTWHWVVVTRNNLMMPCMA